MVQGCVSVGIAGAGAGTSVLTLQLVAGSFFHWLQGTLQLIAGYFTTGCRYFTIDCRGVLQLIAGYFAIDCRVLCN